MELELRDRDRNPGLSLAKELRKLLDETPVGSTLEIASSSTICASLELLIPTVISASRPAWRAESLDGVFVERAVRTGVASAQIAGCCILMSDQALSPILVDLSIDETADELRTVRVRVGEPGQGPLGISGPKCGSPGADKYRGNVVARLGRIAWVYDCVT